MDRRPPVRILIVMLAFALVVAACGDDDAEPATVAPTTVATTTATPATPATTQPAQDVTFVMALPTVNTSVEPDVYEGDATLRMGAQRESTLFIYDTDVRDACAQLGSVDDLKGSLAESWEFNDDETILTITLREMVSPAGNPLTSEDVRWTFERLDTLQTGFTGFFMRRVARFADDPIRVIDDRTFEVHSTEPSIFTRIAMTWNDMAIIDSTEALSHATAEDPWASEWLTTNTATFGPWQVVDGLDPGNELVMVANDNYWDSSRGNIDRLVMRAVSESSARLQLLQAGDVDYAYPLTITEYEALKTSEGVNVISCTSANRDMLVLNVNDERFADKRVRQAISMAIDRSEIVTGAYRGFGLPSITGLHQSFDFPIPDGPGYHYDPEAAKALLAEAGYPDGFDLELMYTPERPGPHAEQVAILLKSQLAAVGINVDILLIPSNAEFRDRDRAGNFEALFTPESPAFPNAAYVQILRNICDALQPQHGYCNEEFDALVAELSVVGLNSEDEKRLMTELSAMIVDEVPVIHLVDREIVHAFRDTVTGFQGRQNEEIIVSQLSK